MICFYFLAEGCKDGDDTPTYVCNEFAVALARNFNNRRRVITGPTVGTPSLERSS